MTGSSFVTFWVMTEPKSCTLGFLYPFALCADFNLKC